MLFVLHRFSTESGKIVTPKRLRWPGNWRYLSEAVSKCHAPFIDLLTMPHTMPRKPHTMPHTMPRNPHTMPHTMPRKPHTMQYMRQYTMPRNPHTIRRNPNTMRLAPHTIRRDPSTLQHTMPRKPHTMPQALTFTPNLPHCNAHSPFPRLRYLFRPILGAIGVRCVESCRAVVVRPCRCRFLVPFHLPFRTMTPTLILALIPSGHPDTFEGFHAEESNVENVIRHANVFAASRASFQPFSRASLCAVQDSALVPVLAEDTYALRAILARAERESRTVLIRFGLVSLSHSIL